MKHKLVALTFATLVGLSAVAFGVARAQRPASNAPAEKTAPCPCMQGQMQDGMACMMGMMPNRSMGHMGQGMMGMQPGMMGGCPMMVPGAKVEVKSLDKGATITITSEDTKTARRIQLMAEMMRLMHELRSEQ